MKHLLLIWMFAAILILNIVLSVVVHRRETGYKRALLLTSIWMFPLLGVFLVLAVIGPKPAEQARRVDEPHVPWV